MAGSAWPRLLKFLVGTPEPSCDGDGWTMQYHLKWGGAFWGVLFISWTPSSWTGFFGNTGMFVLEGPLI